MYHLIGKDGKEYLSSEKGTIGGHRKLKIYGRLDCPSALRHIQNGNYVNHRVFFTDELTAIQAGYRPCAVCMKEHYKQWKEGKIMFGVGNQTWKKDKKFISTSNGRKWITKDEFTVQEFADFDSYIISVEGNIRRYKYLHFYKYRTRIENEFLQYSSFYITGNKSKKVIGKYTLYFQLVKNPKEMIGEIQDKNICNLKKHSKRAVLIDDCGEKKILDGAWDATKYFIEYVKKLGEGK